MKKILVMLLSASLLFGCAYNKASGGEKSTDEIKANLQKILPGFPSNAVVHKAPLAGVYEVAVGRRVFYVSADGKYLFFGNLIDAESKKNLTEQRVMELSKIDWNKLPLDLAIKTVNGNGRRQLVVFADPECPYCQMFEQKLAPALTDTTIYTFIYPIASHKNSDTDVIKIWCSMDKAQVWHAWMTKKTPLPTNMACDTSGIIKIKNIAESLVQLEATPTLILGNGQIMQGLLAPDQMLKAMDEAQGLQVSSSDANASGGSKAISKPAKKK